LLTPALDLSDLGVGETRGTEGDEFTIRRRGTLQGFEKERAPGYGHGDVLASI
jgi:hypothetical protein